MSDLHGPTPEDEAVRDDLTEDARIRADFVKEVQIALDDGDEAAIRTLVGHLHAADLADVLEFLGSSDRRALVAVLGETLDPEVLSELEDATRDDVLSALEPEAVADAVTQLETDDAVLVLEDLDEDEQQEVLEKLPADDRAAIEEGLAYPEDTAGRLMQRDLIAVPPFWTVGQTIDYMREEDDLPDEFYEIFIVDPSHKPIGTVALNRLMRTKRPVKIEEIMDPDLHVVPVEMDQEDVAHIIAQYNLVSAPVADGDGRLVGVVTVDDIVDVVEDEAEEDLLAMSGVSDGDINISLLDVTKTRFTWLLVNLGTAILASVVIGMFDTSIEKLVALAVLMPIVASMGGNAGTQTMAVAVRALATKELTQSNAMRVVNKEMAVSLINGALLAIVIGVVAALWFASNELGLIIAAAMIINMFVAGLSGILVPMSLERAGIDPAVASSVFVTTITDVVGFFAFLGLAAWLLL